MLAMAEWLGHEVLLWDIDQSWAFPILGGDQENGGKMTLVDMDNLEGQTSKGRSVEAPPPAKGRKRSAASNSGGSDQGKKGKSLESGSGGGSGEFDEHELHIWTERERRKKMRNMFATLHSLIPHLPPRVDKSTVVDEAVTYIKKLRVTLAELEKVKAERLKGCTANVTACDNIIPSMITHQKRPIQSREAFLADQQESSTAAVTLADPNPFSSGPVYPPVFKTWASPNVILNICGQHAHINVCCPKKAGLLTAILLVMEKYKIEVVSAQVSSDQNRRMYMIHAHANGAPKLFSAEALFLVEEMYKHAAAEIMLCVNSL